MLFFCLLLKKIQKLFFLFFSVYLITQALYLESSDSIPFHIQDINGVKWFKIHGSAFSMKEKRKMEDIDGIELCGYQKKMLSMHGTAYITIQDQSGSTLVVATIKSVMNI